MAVFPCGIVIFLIALLSFSPSIGQKIAKQPQVTYDNGVEEIQDLSRYLQPNDLLSGKYDYRKPTEYQCARDCSLYPESRLCYHKFVVEQYHAMGPACDGCPEDENACYATHCACANGIEKTILTINRQLCSPAIMVCRGDRVVIDVVNKMLARSTSIHSHGIHFKGYQWMDGSSQVTQCPIIEGQTFRYEYPMEQVGDFLYHAHDGIQMFDGLQGPLISRSRMPDPHVDEYDEDLLSHTMFIQDWMNVLSDDRLPGYNKVFIKYGFDNVESYLINGHGSFTREDGTTTGTPYTVFNVRPGKRYRFRIVSSVNMPAIFTVEGHNFKLITMDADPIRTVYGSSLLIATGERYGIVISADNQPRSYWIQIKALNGGTVQYAILRYVNDRGTPIRGSRIPKTKVPLKFGKPILNDVSGDCDPANTTSICIDQFEALNTTPSILLQNEPDYRLFLVPSFHHFEPKELYVDGLYYKHYVPFRGPSIGGGMFSDVYNNITTSLPPFSMLTESDPFPKDLICGEECFTPNAFCECTLLYKIPLGAVVEIVFIDGTPVPGIYHSHHLHGYSYRVIKQGKAGEEMYNPNFYRNIIPMDYTLFPLKDTILVPSQGYAVVRFWATNPGMWMLHCHITTHIHLGMTTVLQIGERSEFPNPPVGFPSCGNFVPNVRFP